MQPPEQAIDQALASVDRKGTILFFAVPQNDVSIPSQRLWRDEITIAFSYGAGPDDLRAAIELIRSGAINAGEMVTHRVTLSEIMQGFKLVSEARDSLKVVVVPDTD